MTTVRSQRLVSCYTRAARSWLLQKQHPPIASLYGQSRSRLFHSSSLSLAKLTVQGLAERVDLQGTNVLVRGDLNVPLSDDGTTVTDTTRLRAVVPTLQFLWNQGANIILCSHLGRPKGRIIETGPNGRLAPIVAPLQDLLGDSMPIHFLPFSPSTLSLVEQVQSVQSKASHRCPIVLLDNLRFHPEETKNGDSWSQQLGELADYFVLDAFGTAHRAHSSTVGVTQFTKLNAAGYSLQRELQFFQTAVLEQPKRPLVAIVGGAKVSTKLPVLQQLLHKCDTILLGGAMIFTFYKAFAPEWNIGRSLWEPDQVELARVLLKQQEAKLIVPVDVVMASQMDNRAESTVVRVGSDMNDDWMGLDIGPETLELYRREIAQAETIVFNGPMGVFEIPKFARGTVEVARRMAHATQTRGAISIVGGGDSVAAIHQAGLEDQVSHLSTGGGASLELLEGKELPGIAALTDV